MFAHLRGGVRRRDRQEVGAARLLRAEAAQVLNSENELYV